MLKRLLVSKCFGSFIEKVLLEIRRKYRYKKQQDNPLVSVVIATYNRGKILCERTLPSIFNQSYKNIEVIVVGDHVADNTSELIKNIKDKRLIYINLPKRSAYPSEVLDRWMVAGAFPRNVGVARAVGEWIYIISDDDILMPEAIQKLVDFSKTGDFESVSANYISYKDGLQSIFTADDIEKTLGIYMTGIPAWMYKKHLSIFRWNKNSWKKKWNRPSDYDLQHRMKNAGVKMGYLNDTIAISPIVEGTNLTGSKAQLYLSNAEK